MASLLRIAHRRRALDQGRTRASPTFGTLPLAAKVRCGSFATNSLRAKDRSMSGMPPNADAKLEHCICRDGVCIAAGGAPRPGMPRDEIVRRGLYLYELPIGAAVLPGALRQEAK
jgi:hypothetical protein